MPHATRPGDLLAGRYRLVDLLSESGDGRFWRAHDGVLERWVALHVIGSADERAEDLLEAARRSAVVHDPRLLRVLDAERTERICYVVNEWGEGTSLDIVVATHGPLTPRAAAWLVGQVAESLTTAHEAGVPHGRLVPENVLVDRTGAVRLIGFAVDAALHGCGPGSANADVVDLAGLLHCALTGRWAGASTSAVPAAPREGDRCLRPRQVRAGVPRVLDQLCDDLLNPSDLRTHDARRTESARAFADVLLDFVGDPAGLAEQLAAANVKPGQQQVVLPPLEDAPVREDPQATVVVPVAPGTDRPGPDVDPPPTEAGMPIFDDEAEEVDWLRTRSVPPPPPPPFEEPPERPLFAPDPDGGRPARTPRDGAGPAPTGDYWPWDGTGHGTGIGQGPLTVGAHAPDSAAIPLLPEHDVPGRRTLRLALAVGAAVILLVSIVVGLTLDGGRSFLGADAEEPPTTPPPTTAAAPVPLEGLTADDLDPQGEDGTENPDTVGNVVDGDPTTTWRTVTYLQQLGPAGLKTGLGVVLDLGSAQEVAEVDVRLVGEPTRVALYLTDTPPEGVAGLRPVVTRSLGARGTLELPAPTTTRYVVLWLTALPAVPDGFRGEVAEVEVRG